MELEHVVNLYKASERTVRFREEARRRGVPLRRSKRLDTAARSRLQQFGDSVRHFSDRAAETTGNLRDATENARLTAKEVGTTATRLSNDVKTVAQTPTGEKLASAAENVSARGADAMAIRRGAAEGTMDPQAAGKALSRGAGRATAIKVAGGAATLGGTVLARRYLARRAAADAARAAAAKRRAGVLAAGVAGAGVGGGTAAVGAASSRRRDS